MPDYMIQAVKWDPFSATLLLIWLLSIYAIISEMKKAARWMDNRLKQTDSRPLQPLETFVYPPQLRLVQRRREGGALQRKTGTDREVRPVQELNGATSNAPSGEIRQQ